MVLLYNIVSIAPLLMIFNAISQSSLRVANYFYIFLILLLPNVIKSIGNQKERIVVIFVLVGFCLSYYLINGISFLGCGNYLFYWE